MHDLAREYLADRNPVIIPCIVVIIRLFISIICYVIFISLSTKFSRTKFDLVLMGISLSDLLTITGLTADEHTLYTLEMGRYDIDSMARLSAFSLTTGKHKVLWSAEYGSDPRALFLDSTNRSVTRIFELVITLIIYNFNSLTSNTNSCKANDRNQRI